MRQSNTSRHVLFALFRRLVRTIGGRGLRLHRLPLMNRCYRKIFRLLAPADPTVVQVHGSLLVVNPADRTLRDSLLIFGTHERFETNIIKSLLRPGMTFVDVGANIGYYTVVAGAVVGSTGRVVAFEPDTTNFDFLQKSIAANRFTHVRALRCALSDRAGTATLYLSDHLGSHSLAQQDVCTRSVTVPVTTLDDNENLFPAGIDLVKLDAQGAEGHILRGGKKLLGRWKPVIIAEFEPRCLEKMGTDPQELLRMIHEDLEYEINVLDTDNRRIVPVLLPGWKSLDRNSVNLLLIHRTQRSCAGRERGETA